MGFNMRQRQPLAQGHALQCADLIVQHGDDFIVLELHAAPAKSGSIRVRGVCAYGYIVLPSKGQCALQGLRVTGMVATGDIGQIDIRHDSGLRPIPPVTVALTKVTIELHALFAPRARPVSCCARQSPACSQDCG